MTKKRLKVWLNAWCSTSIVLWLRQQLAFLSPAEELALSFEHQHLQELKHGKQYTEISCAVDIYEQNQNEKELRAKECQ